VSKLCYITAELCVSLTAVNDKRRSEGVARYVYAHGHQKMRLHWYLEEEMGKLERNFRSMGIEYLECWHPLVLC